MLVAGLMERHQYKMAEHDLIGNIQGMVEREGGHVVAAPHSLLSDSENMDDPQVRTNSSERDKAVAEYGTFCNLCKKGRNRPRTYVGETLTLIGPDSTIEMGKVGIRGEDIRATVPFVDCNLADFVGKDGEFDLLRFFHLQRYCFPGGELIFSEDE